MAAYQESKFLFVAKPKQLNGLLRMQLKSMFVYTAGSGAAKSVI
jgi:hypothetical protein